MKALGSVVVVLLACSTKETKPDLAGSAAEPVKQPTPSPAETKTEPAKAEPAKAEPAKPAQRPPPDKAQIRKSLMIGGKTHSSQFSCSGAGGNWKGIFDLAADHIKKMTIAKTTVDGDFAVIEVDVELRRGLAFSRKLAVVGPVKLRYRWEAEWVLQARDSTGVTCTES